MDPDPAKHPLNFEKAHPPNLQPTQLRDKVQNIPLSFRQPSLNDPPFMVPFRFLFRGGMRGEKFGFSYRASCHSVTKGPECESEEGIPGGNTPFSLGPRGRLEVSVDGGIVYGVRANNLSQENIGRAIDWERLELSRR